MLLKKIWLKDKPYNSSTDMVVFFHPLKTGGTSVSDVLAKLGPVLPGSARSYNFDFSRLKDVGDGMRRSLGESNRSMNQLCGINSVWNSHIVPIDPTAMY